MASQPSDWFHVPTGRPHYLLLFTALALLLPVLAGQSGNTGAQAFAILPMKSVAEKLA